MLFFLLQMDNNEYENIKMTANDTVFEYCFNLGKISCMCDKVEEALQRTNIEICWNSMNTSFKYN